MWMRRYKRRNMIEITIIFIIGENKDGLFPDFRIFRQDVHHFTDIPGAIPCRAGMIGKIFGCHQPGYCRQLSLLYIVPELMEYIAFGNFYFTFLIAFLIL